MHMAKTEECDCHWLHIVRRPTGSQETDIQGPFAFTLSFGDGTKHLCDICSKHIYIFCRRFEGLRADHGKRYDHGS